MNFIFLNISNKTEILGFLLLKRNLSRTPLPFLLSNSFGLTPSPPSLVLLLNPFILFSRVDIGQDGIVM